MSNDDTEKVAIIRKIGYDPQTGEITQVLEGLIDILVVPEDTAEEAFIDGYGDGRTQKVVDGQLVDKDASAMDALELEEAWVIFTDKRARMLFSSDWTQVPDSPVDTAAWAVYRQKLRDLPSTALDPRDFVWPTPP